MPARKPEECDLLLMEAAHAGDVEAAVALYEPIASVQDSGEVVTRHAAIRGLPCAEAPFHYEGGRRTERRRDFSADPFDVEHDRHRSGG